MSTRDTLGNQIMEDREGRLALLDAAIERGMADIEGGRTQAAEDVFDELKARYAR